MLQQRKEESVIYCSNFPENSVPPGRGRGSNTQVSLQFAAFRPLTRPFVKVFLGALFTYQVVYWAWLRLETDELKLQKNSRLNESFGKKFFFFPLSYYYY